MERGLTILFVDDDEAIVRLMTGFLSRRGHRVIPCSGVRDALCASAGDDVIDVMVTDLHLCDGSGEDLVYTFLEKRPLARTLILTGDDLETLHDLPTSVLEKPVGGPQLLRAITGS